MVNLKNIYWSGKLIFLTLFSSLLIGFYFNEDLSTGGATSDFYLFVWKFTLALGENFLHTYSNWEEAHLPLHAIILSFFNFFFNDDIKVRFFYCIIATSVPVLFYVNLSMKFPNINKNLLFIFSSAIFLLPAFRYTAIWANFQISAIIFLLFSNIFFLKWIKKNDDKVDKNIVFQILLMTLAVYTRADYILFFLYFMFIYFQKLKIIEFVKLSIFVIFLSIHGLWFIYDHFVTFSNIQFTPKFQNYILVNASIISFYLMPIFLCSAFNNINFFKKDINFFVMSTLIFSILIYIFAYSFDYNYSLGGGFILKLSLLLFNNNLLFYLSSIAGLVLLSFLSKNNVNNLLIILLILFGYSSAVIFHKYFEPTFMIIFFLLMKSEVISQFLSKYKNIFFLYIYFFVYYASAFLNNIFEFSKSI